jgi:hypothetical protein
LSGWAAFLFGLGGPALANTPPQAVADQVEASHEPVLVDVLANDEDPDGDRLTVALTRLPAFGTVSDEGDGTFTYTPGAGFAGQGGDSFDYTVSDGQGGSGLATVTIVEGAGAAPAVPPATLLYDDFNDGDFLGWSIVDFGTNAAPSSWSASLLALVQSSNIWDPFLGRGTHAIYDAGMAWTDYRVALRFGSNDDDRIGVAFRYQDGNNHYRFEWLRQGSALRLVKIENGVWTTLAETPGAYVMGLMYHLEVVAQGSQIEIFLDGAPLFSVTDPAFAFGTVALVSDGNAGSVFDNVEVTELPVVPPVELLAEDFNDGLMDGWQVEDFGVTNAPSSWTAASGEMAQWSNIWNDPLRRGTYLLYTGGNAWTDYRVQLTLRSGDNDWIGVLLRYQGTEHHYRWEWSAQLGLMILARIEEGQFLTLAQISRSYRVQDPNVVEIVVRGPQIEVFVDNEPVMSVVDEGGLVQGTMGLYTSGNAGGFFDNIRVEEVE